MKFTDEQFKKFLEYVDQSMKVEEERHKRRRREFEDALEEYRLAMDAGDSRRLSEAFRVLGTFPDFKYINMPLLPHRSHINTHMFDYTRFGDKNDGGSEEG